METDWGGPGASDLVLGWDLGGGLSGGDVPDQEKQKQAQRQKITLYTHEARAKAAL